MATRRRRSSGGTVDRTAVLLEQIHEQNRATIEAVQSQGTSIRREMAEMRRDLMLRIEALEGAVRQNSADIRQNSEELRKHSEELRKHSEELGHHSAEIRQNSEDIRQMKAQLVEMTAVLRGKPDAASLEKLEARVSALERRVGI